MTITSHIDPVQKPKRPRDANQRAKHVVDLATGQSQELCNEEVKDENAAAMGRKGGRARADKLTPEQRSEIARKAAAARWKKET